MITQDQLKTRATEAADLIQRVTACTQSVIIAQRNLANVQKQLTEHKTLFLNEIEQFYSQPPELEVVK